MRMLYFKAESPVLKIIFASGICDDPKEKVLPTVIANYDRARSKFQYLAGQLRNFAPPRNGQ